MTKDKFELILSDIEKEKIRQFYNDETLREAVKKVLLFFAYNNGTLKPDENAEPSMNFALSLISRNPSATDKEIADDLRASFKGIQFVEFGFSNLARFRDEPKKTVETIINEAR